MTSNGARVVIVVLSIAPRWIAMGAFSGSGTARGVDILRVEAREMKRVLFIRHAPYERGLSLSSEEHRG